MDHGPKGCPLSFPAPQQAAPASPSDRDASQSLQIPKFVILGRIVAAHLCLNHFRFGYNPIFLSLFYLYSTEQILPLYVFALLQICIKLP